jgi:hypothetical protein
MVVKGNICVQRLLVDTVVVICLLSD